MILKRIMIALIFLTFCTTVLAEDDWGNVASDDKYEISIKVNSLEFEKTKSGSVIAVVVGRITDIETSQITFFKWYVSGSDCSAKMGKLVTLNINGDYINEVDFVFSGGNIGSSIAETICGAATGAAMKAIKSTEENDL